MSYIKLNSAMPEKKKKKDLNSQFSQKALSLKTLVSFFKNKVNCGSSDPPT